jgi:hypothetical protein
MSEEKQEPELVVDTDWKAQVEKEKQQAESTDQEPKAAETGETIAQESASEGEDSSQALPPASLATVITTFYSQAMVCLGAMPNPATGETEPHLPMAKHLIDTVEILQEKTSGNTNEEEAKMFDEVLHLLRMAYVGATRQE